MSVLGAIFGGIVELFRQGRNKRAYNQRLNEIDNENINRRNVVEYRSAPIEAFLPQTANNNVVVSGSNDEIRERVICARAWKCHLDNRPTLILHCGNLNLADRLAQVFQGEDKFLRLDSTNPIYDPFIGLDRSYVSQFILNSSGREYRIERIGSSYLYGLYDYLQQIGRPICTETFYNCMRDRSHEHIIQDSEDGVISEFIARRINSELAQGQLEMGNIEQYFNVLRQQGCDLLADEYNLNNAISIRRALHNGKIVALDISDSANTLLLDIVVQEIRALLSDHIQISLIIDSISIDATETFNQLIRTYSGTNSLLLSSPDVYSSMQSTATHFEAILGRAETVIALQHYSSSSATKFSEFFGNYQKLEVTQQFGSGRSGRFGEVFRGTYDNNGSSVQPVVKPRVEESDITGQRDDHAYIKQRGRTEIIDVRIDNGDARSNYVIPERAPTRRTHRHSTMSWGIFILLFIFFFPAAFIYSFVKTGKKGKIISAIFFFVLMALFITQCVLSFNGLQGS